jgi:hypothetical protein
MSEDEDLDQLAAKLSVLKHDAPMRALPERPIRKRPLWIWPIAGVGALIAFVVLLAQGTGDVALCGGSAGFQFSVTAGTATCGGDAMTTGVLPVDAALVTKHDGALTMKIADIGELTVFGDTALRLVATGPAGHHLALLAGHVSAKVTAPPKLFVVDTPGAPVVDLGCAYDLTVDPATGKTHVRVTNGAVTLGDAYVPATFEVDLARGGRGTPVSVTATAAVRDAVAHFDAGGPISELVAAADMPDRVTLWNAIAKTHDASAIAKLEQLAPLPNMHDKLLAGDADAMDMWLDVFVDRGALAHKK